MLKIHAVLHLKDGLTASYYCPAQLPFHHSPVFFLADCFVLLVLLFGLSPSLLLTHRAPSEALVLCGEVKQLADRLPTTTSHEKT